MKKIALGAMLVLGVAIGAASPSFAAGAGLDPQSRATGNGQNGAMKRNAYRESAGVSRRHWYRRHPRYGRHNL